jgi:hypothetical protein
LEAEEVEQTGRNENEPHPMSFENSLTGDKPSTSSFGEGRREQARQWTSLVHRSGGVCMDSTSESKVSVNRENSGVGKTKSQLAAQADLSSEPDGNAGVVGVPHIKTND